MKLRFLLFMLLLGGMLHAQTTHQALFLGNSYTGVNDLPSIVQSLTEAGGDSLVKDVNAPGGYTLQGHSTNATSLAMLNARAWDFVILQEQSQLPSFPQSQVQNQVYPYATQLDDSIEAHDSCTVTVFYMTWGRKYGDSQNCAGWPPVCTFEGMTTQLRMSYLNMANQNEALVAPCGVAWWETKQRDSTVELFSGDYSHPSYAGSYLNGCVFYATMYRRSPVGLGFYGLLDTTTATFLQQVAHDVVFDSLAQWRIGLDDAQAAWTATVLPDGSATFSNTSQNANAFHWDLGDGSTSTDVAPTHAYQQSGSYVVTLIATDGCTSDTLVDTLDVVIVHRPDPAAATLTAAPNPTDGWLKVSGTPPMAGSIQVLDLQGRLLLEQPVQPDAQGFAQAVDLRGFAPGTYVLRVGGESRRIVVQ